jgi:hypothetical protein
MGQSTNPIRSSTTNPSGSPTTTMALNVGYGLGKIGTLLDLVTRQALLATQSLNQLLRLQLDIVDMSCYVVSSKCGCEL